MGASWITGICVKRNRLEWTVLRRAKEAWDVHSRGEAEWPGPPGGEGTGAALRPQIKGIRGRLAIALPGDQALLRVALLPSTDPDELRGMSELQTDKYSPFPVETMALGAETLETTEASSLVVMAAVRRDLVDAWGRTIQEAAALPDRVDVEPLGWWWVLKQSGAVPALGSQLLVRQDGANVDLILARDGAPLLFRSLPPRPEAADAADLQAWMAECVEETGYSLTSLETEWGEAAAPTLHVFRPWTNRRTGRNLRAALGLQRSAVYAFAGRAADGVGRPGAPRHRSRRSLTGSGAGGMARGRRRARCAAACCARSRYSPPPGCWGSDCSGRC